MVHKWLKAKVVASTNWKKPSKMPTVVNLTGHGLLVAKLPRESEQFQQAARDPPKTSFF